MKRQKAYLILEMEGVEWIKRESTVLIFSVELWNFLYETKLVELGTAKKERERARGESVHVAPLHADTSSPMWLYSNLTLPHCPVIITYFILKAA